MTLRSAIFVWMALATPFVGAGPAKPLRPVVTAEEDVYDYVSPENGSGPMWCHGSTCIVRSGSRVFVSGIETLADAKPLNNVRWTLYERTAAGWQRRQADPVDRTREPSPLAVLGDGRLFLSVNPTLSTERDTYSGPARPELLAFNSRDAGGPISRLLPIWEGSPKFTEHSYRSFAADGPNHRLLLLQNIDYTHAEWSFMDLRHGKSAQGRLTWPMGSDYAKPQPIRVCYPDVAVVGKAVYFCGISDIIEPNPAWRAFKKELTGKEWDYDFRRLFFTWTPDITRTPFAPWIEIASREKTCGWISPGDLWVAPNGDVHLVWTERALDDRLRSTFFPGERQSHSLVYAKLRKGTVVLRRTVLEAVEGGSGAIPSGGRFHTIPEGRLLILCHVGGGAAGNRLYEVRRDGTIDDPIHIGFRTPFTTFFTATPRAGSSPSRTIDLLGHQAGKPLTLSYGQIRLE
jgi:hypothetical protein